MAEVIATNLLPRPKPIDGIGNAAWFKSGGSNASVKTADRYAVEVLALNTKQGATATDNGAAVYTPVSLVAGESYTFTYETLERYPTNGKLLVAFVDATTAANNAGNSVILETGELTGTIICPTPAPQFLRLVPFTAYSYLVAVGMRLSLTSEVDELGIFDGDTTDTETTAYEWTGDTQNSPSTAEPATVVPDPGDPDPEPEPDPDPTWITEIAQRVAATLGAPGDESLESQALVHAEIITDYVWGYTRGKGFDVLDVPVRPLKSVIVAATARMAGNPEQVSYFVTGDYSERPAVMSGWMLHELSVLNNYRRRYA